MEKQSYKYPIYFLLLYAFTYMCNAVYGTFVPVYLDHIGYNKTDIGSLLALAPFIAILAQPLWGMAGDRAKTKNTILRILILGSAICIALYSLSTAFYYLAAVIAFFTFFQSSINPMSDAITLEYITTTKWKFGHIRMAGTIGYAIMSIIAGTLAKKNINVIFILYFILAIFALTATVPLPKVKGHQSEGKKVSLLKLFKHKQLVIFMTLNLIVQITLGFYNTFFSIYFRGMGADNFLLGVAMFISAGSEIPFLLFAHHVFKKIKIHYVLLFAAFAAAVRWLLLASITNPLVVLPFQLMHGMIFIVISVSMATYINQEVPKELKASGQAINGLIGMGIARIIGSLLGGYLSDVFGIKLVFVYNSIFAFAAVVIFGLLFIRQAGKPIKE